MTASLSDWDEEEVTVVDEIAQLPMIKMRDQDREEFRAKPTLRLKPIRKSNDDGR